MAFQNKDVAVVAYANGFTLWHYRSTDSIEQISKNYFPKEFAQLMATGDIMIINAGDTTCIKLIELTTDSGEIVLKNL